MLRRTGEQWERGALRVHPRFRGFDDEHRRQRQPQTPLTVQIFNSDAPIQHVQSKLADWHYHGSRLHRVFCAWWRHETDRVAKRARAAARWLHRQAPELRNGAAADELPDHYAAVGVPRDADPATIAAAFRARALQTHPDKQGGSDRPFRRVKEAFEVIKRAANKEASQPEKHRKRLTDCKRSRERKLQKRASRKRQKRASRKRRKRTKRYGTHHGAGAHPDKWSLDVVNRYYKAIN